jgi:hypothetical protein
VQSALGTVPEISADGDESNEEEAVVSLLGDEPKNQRGGRVADVTFGVESTNSPSKRGLGAAIYGDVARYSPSKRRRG